MTHLQVINICEDRCIIWDQLVPKTLGYKIWTWKQYTESNRYNELVLTIVNHFIPSSKEEDSKWMTWFAVLQIAYTGKWTLQQQVFFFFGNIIDDDSEGGENKWGREKNSMFGLWMKRWFHRCFKQNQQPGTSSLLYTVVATSCFYSSCSSVTS